MPNACQTAWAASLASACHRTRALDANKSCRAPPIRASTAASACQLASATDASVQWAFRVSIARWVSYTMQINIYIYIIVAWKNLNDYFDIFLFEKKEENFNLFYIVVVSVIFVVIGNFSWVFFWRRRRRIFFAIFSIFYFHFLIQP